MSRITAPIEGNALLADLPVGLSWSSPIEMQAVAFCDPIAGVDSTVYARCDLLDIFERDLQTSAVLSLDKASRVLTCGRAQLDFEQYGPTGLDYSTVKSLVIDTGRNCYTPPTGEEHGAVPEPSTAVLLATSFALAVFARRLLR